MSEMKCPQDYWKRLGICLGMAFGVPVSLLIGILLSNVLLGIFLAPAFGFILGLGVGKGFEDKCGCNYRGLNENEKIIDFGFKFIAIVSFIVSIFYLVWFYFSNLA